MGTTTVLVVSVGLLVILQKFLALRGVLRAVQYRPGFRTLLAITNVTSMFPPIPFVSVGNVAFKNKHDIFEKYDADIFTAISVLPSPEVNFIVSDAQAIKEIVGARARFPKPIQLYTALLMFGSNIVASEHDEWKRYRKISAPAFTEPNNRLVWDVTVNVLNDLFNNIWGDKKQITVDHALELTMPIALFVISAAGFGRRLTWNNELKPPQGHTMTFKDALFVVSEGLPIKMLVPKWVSAFSAHVRKVHNGFDELEKYMLEMIESRKQMDTKEQQYDLFNSLLVANDDNVDNIKLSNGELLGNIFIFLFAGHETTSHTLCFALGLLALYPDEQDRVYQEVVKAIPENRDPTFQDLTALNYVHCVLNETLRMFPSVVGIPKEAAENCTLSTTNGTGEKVTVPIPKGSGINISAIGLHYNPKYWEDPMTFRPSRFQGDWPRDAFLPFSGGVRSCLGRRFAELESIVVLTMLVKNYKITIKDESRFAGETFEQRKERVLKAKHGLTLTPVRTPLQFTRRN